METNKRKTIYTITPSWLIEKKQNFIDSIKILEELGFKVLNKKIPKKLPAPEQKAKEIHSAFLNKDVDILLAQRGGYSAMKVLPYINFSLIKDNPKIIAGFSDMTALLNSIYETTGIVTLHSPMILNLDNPSQFTVNSFMNALYGFNEKNLFKDAPVYVYNHGIVNGILKGGNLITLTALINTKWDINTKDCIIFLEDVDEKLHQIDRYLTQWILSGKFNGVKGLILGDFRGVNNKEVLKILKTQMKINFPVVYCPYIGHVENKITLPVGAKVEFNTYKKTLLIK